jgi:hypothetical protein
VAHAVDSVNSNSSTCLDSDSSVFGAKGEPTRPSSPRAQSARKAPEAAATVESAVAPRRTMALLQRPSAAISNTTKFQLGLAWTVLEFVHVLIDPLYRAVSERWQVGSPPPPERAYAASPDARLQRGSRQVLKFRSSTTQLTIVWGGGGRGGGGRVLSRRVYCRRA